MLEKLHCDDDESVRILKTLVFLLTLVIVFARNQSYFASLSLYFSSVKFFYVIVSGFRFCSLSRL